MFTPTLNVCFFSSALARKVVFERRTQIVLGTERGGRHVRWWYVTVLRRQSDGVLSDTAVGRPVREHAGPTATATGPERDACLHAARAHHAW